MTKIKYKYLNMHSKCTPNINAISVAYNMQESASQIGVRFTLQGE